MTGGEFEKSGHLCVEELAQVDFGQRLANPYCQGGLGFEFDYLVTT